MALAARGVLIDLDGTLLDTVPDLAAAVNAMLAELGRPPLTVERVAAFVGKGADVLVHMSLTGALDGRADEAQFQRGKEAFYRHYREFNGRRSVVFRGVPDALAELRGKRIALACVTNKPGEFTHELLQRVGLDSEFEAVVSGDDTREKKPHPAPMLRACELLGLPPSDTAMVGDSLNDVLSARAAGCRVIVVETGYNEGQSVGELPADAIVPTLLDAARLIEPMPS
jgi:phosphoglycolate phosphatase